jgi:hypothetical protein
VGGTDTIGEGQSTVARVCHKESNIYGLKLFSVTVDPWGERIGEGQFTVAKVCHKEIHIHGLKLFTVTVQPWEERIPVGKDNLLLRECVIKRATFLASKLFSVYSPAVGGTDTGWEGQ